MEDDSMRSETMLEQRLINMTYVSIEIPGEEDDIDIDDEQCSTSGTDADADAPSLSDPGPTSPSRPAGPSHPVSAASADI